MFLKGISGAQKRRMSIGMELIVRPKIMFLGKAVGRFTSPTRPPLAMLSVNIAATAGYG